MPLTCRPSRAFALGLAIFAALSLAQSWPARAATLDDVKARGELVCGVSEGLVGFSAEVAGVWRGFDVDVCRAVAAAVFGDAAKVRYVSLTAAQRFDALKAGEIDLLSRNTTWTMSREVVGDMAFVGVSYHDGQGFMVPISAGLSSALQLTDAKVCAVRATTSEESARKFIEANSLKSELVLFDRRDEALAAYAKGDCGAYTADLSALASQRSQLAKPDQHALLPDVITKEPLGPVVRIADPSWRRLVQWVLFLLINAEEAGWTAADATSGKPSPFTISPEVTAKLGLVDDWSTKAVSAVGNYGEMFERHVGAGSALKLGRGMNALWTRGGILFAPPMR